jgi:hypothetical protein
MKEMMLHGVKNHVAQLNGYGAIVVDAPMATKPLLGGSNNCVPADTRSGSLMLFNSTSAGALRLNFIAIAKSDSPDCTTYVRGAVVGPGAIVVVVVPTPGTSVVSLAEPEPPSVRRPEMIARKTNAHVLHNRYMWRRVRRNIPLMLRR